MSTIRVRSPASYWLAAPAAAWMLGVVVVPIVLLVWVSFWGGRAFSTASPLTLDNYTKFFANQTYIKLIGSTVVHTATLMAVTGVLGYCIAYFLVVKVRSPRWRLVLFLAFIIPFWTSTLIRAIAWVPFLGVRIEVGPGALIPRPETEMLAHTALDLWHGMNSPAPRVAVDVGTGSGCIAVALAIADSSLRVIGLEISDAALFWAGRNTVANGAGANVELYRSDLFSAFRDLGFPRGGASLIVSNPPYLALGDAAALPRDVAGHEPPEALYSGQSGLEHLRRIVEESPEWLSAPGLLDRKSVV